MKINVLYKGLVAMVFKMCASKIFIRQLFDDKNFTILIYILLETVEKFWSKVTYLLLENTQTLLVYA